MATALVLALTEGDKAPDFTLPVQGGKRVSLSQFLGKRVVLFFYPRDNTSGCTQEACAFRDVQGEFDQAQTVVLGLSADSSQSHERFAKKFQLPFLLLADEEKTTLQAYGAWGEKQFLGRNYFGIHRVTFLIGREGRIEKIWTQVKPKIHARQVLEFLG